MKIINCVAGFCTLIDRGLEWLSRDVRRQVERNRGERVTQCGH